MLCFFLSCVKRSVLGFGILLTLFSCDPLQTINLRNESSYALCFDDIGSTCTPLINKYSEDTIALELTLLPASDTTLVFEMGGWSKEDAKAIKNCLKTASPKVCNSGQILAIDVSVQREGFGGSSLIITLRDE
ncbi:MAG: hypothetical protein ACI974_002116 [Paraglaciecola sp.]|jgi:hypothetical protein